MERTGGCREVGGVVVKKGRQLTRTKKRTRNSSATLPSLHRFTRIRVMRLGTLYYAWG